MKHFAFSITERTGDTEHTEDMVASIADNEDIVSKLNNLLLDWYADCEWDESDQPPFRVWTPHMSLCWIEDCEKLTPEEFNVASRRINNMTFKLKSY